MVEAVVSEDLRIFDGPNALAHDVAEWLCSLVRECDRDFAICLSGGSTPWHLYKRLAEPAVALRFPWSRVHWFWGDERFVPHDNPASNYRMASETLLSHVQVKDENVHAVPTRGLSADEAAAAYEATLKRFYGADRLDTQRPIFNVTFLGIGGDGHTASLFPGQPMLDETRRWALAVSGARPETRITLTYPVLNSSQNVVFLATGEGKREIVARARAGDRTLPAARIHPVGRLHWFVDRAAAPR